MATEVRCDTCGRTFQHEGAEQSARCPYCQMTVNLSSGPSGGGSVAASGPSPPAEEKPSSSAAGKWHVYTCDGQRFGPITKEELDRWAVEKRLTSSCQVYQDGWPTWRMARAFYPNLPPATGAGAVSAAAPNVGAAAPSPTSQNPYAAPMFAGGGTFSGAAAYQVPHRGALILTFGILGWAICCFFALPAWIMGRTDLQRMKAGEMDNSGYGLTMAGMVLGIIQCIMVAVVMVIYAVIFGVFAASQR